MAITGYSTFPKSHKTGASSSDTFVLYDTCWREGLSPCVDSVSVFYSPSQLGCEEIGHQGNFCRYVLVQGVCMQTSSLQACISDRHATQLEPHVKSHSQHSFRNGGAYKILTFTRHLFIRRSFRYIFKMYFDS